MINSTSLNPNLQGYQIPINSPRPIKSSDEILFQKWNAWEKKAVPGEDRQTAVKIMKDCVDRNAEKLELAGLNLRTLPAGLPPSCTVLILNNNHLTELPPLSDNITRVEVSHNHLTKLSENKPESLTDFQANDNCLTEMSENWPEKMEWIRVDNNQITHLPESLCKSTHLIIINLENNKLVSLPPDLKNLPSFPEIRLKGNPLSDEAKEFAQDYKKFIPNRLYIDFDDRVQSDPAKKAM
ncbi:hypothetical protein [Acerihabitans arboris]|uniref:Uncharacterized protein n=1 Tax=Acerihabitans arboris TaxID=2691583 RepID=A0A845SM02_9GAMM|nr:hypothetical protein [Acerihabitans arboris]NDL63994.1 hypothetical protein [Acerihabitans arboris]